MTPQQQNTCSVESSIMNLPPRRALIIWSEPSHSAWKASIPRFRSLNRKVRRCVGCLTVRIRSSKAEILQALYLWWTNEIKSHTAPSTSRSKWAKMIIERIKHSKDKKKFVCQLKSVKLLQKTRRKRKPAALMTQLPYKEETMGKIPMQSNVTRKSKWESKLMCPMIKKFKNLPLSLINLNF